MTIQALTSLRVDFDFSNPCYVLKLASNSGHLPQSPLLAAALSNNTIKVYQQSIADLRHLVDLKGHEGTITDVSMPLSGSPNLLLSSSADGSVRTWDCQSSDCSERFHAGGDEITSCSCSDNVVAAGGNGTLHFWDRRTRQKLATLEDTHMDIVTVTRFHPNFKPILFTASDDGLMAVFDFSNGINEDDAFVGGQNISNSPLEVGLYGRELDKLWCRSAAETLHLWHWAQDVKDDDNPGQVLHVLDARQQLTQAAGPSLPSIGETVDLLAGCFYDGDDGQLYVAAGSNAGPLAIFPIQPPESAGALFGSPKALLTNVHTEMVRTAVFQGDVVITGGEDARICIWGDPDVLEHRIQAMSGPPAERLHAILPEARHSPY